MASEKGRKPRIGYVGLGNMGVPITTNLVKHGFEVEGFDIAGTAERAPEGVGVAKSTPDLATRCDVVMYSLPDGKVVAEVTEEVISANNRRTTAVLDLSTSGVGPTRETSQRCAGVGLEFYDAPVSGGVPGARNGTISIMFAGSPEAFARYRPILDAVGKPYHVGEEPGQGQAVKILNNFLSATSMIATSEAVAFGVAMGIDPAIIVEVLNASSGRNDATVSKFPQNILPKTYDRGFTNTLLQKDIDLYRDAQKLVGTEDRVGKAIVDAYRRFSSAHPGVDHTRIYPFIRDGDAFSE
jgi:3-hydroxyisobutyrate dehydrogenase